MRCKVRLWPCKHTAQWTESPRSCCIDRAYVCRCLFPCRYELGGQGKMASGAMLTGLWVLYILLASLQAKGSINAALVADSALCPYAT